MLNISNNRIDDFVNKSKYSVFKLLAEKRTGGILIRILLGITIVLFLSLFLPWTQNIRGKGYVTTLNPYDRPQDISALIGGRIDSWHVMEGQEVKIGDTVLVISEVKEKYLDPNILELTEVQIDAKEASRQAYSNKGDNLGKQAIALLLTKENKLSQNQLSINQTRFQIAADSISLTIGLQNLLIAETQKTRYEALNAEGLKSLTDLEEKRIKVQQTEAKIAELENKLNGSRIKLENLETNKAAISNDFEQKLSKVYSDQMGAQSAQFNSEVELNKLKSSYNSIDVRQQNYIIRSPINGIITKLKRSGIGEMLKDGEEVVTIVPTQYQKAVEIYVEPRDLPLLSKGNLVRIQFDGWPAVVFSGWPNSSYGTFGGKVFAIDNYISENGKYRVIVEADETVKPWPKEVRPGGGAYALMLLGEVKLGFEIWRILNGFPASYYENEETNDIKNKAPLKKVK
ncbi:MAG: adhesin transport system membrane fusion protein [Limisphaerales bacterium]|jgi:adhesin transport system membrane fusion protein